MYCHPKQIFLRETDATGVLFFSELLNFGLEALESFFLQEGFSLNAMLKQGGFGMPVVHSAADFFCPLRVGDKILVELSCSKIGKSSFTLTSQIKDQKGKLLGETNIVHVCISLETGQSIPIPEPLLVHLRKL